MEVPQLFCSFQDHSNHLIQGICTRKECERQSALCSKCMFQFHKFCDHHITFLEDLPYKLVNIKNKNNMISQIIETLIVQLREIQQFYQQNFQSIQEYQAIKNMTNLNKIGSMLRQHQNIDANYIQTGCDHIFRIIETYLNPKMKQKVPTQYEFNEAEEWRKESRKHNQNSEFEKAIQCIDKALNINPESDVYLNTKGFSLCNLNQFDEAIQCYDAALKINNKNDSAWFNKGLALNSLHQPSEAIICFDAALQINPNDYLSLNNKGVALNQLNEYQEAIACFDAALEINENDIQALNNKGLALSKLNKYLDAIQCYDKILIIQPNHEMALNNKGFALCKLDQVYEAIQCYDAALKINPNHELALNNKKLAINNLRQTTEIIQCQEVSTSLPQFSSRYHQQSIPSVKFGLSQSIKRFNKILDEGMMRGTSPELDQKYNSTNDRLRSIKNQLRQQKE